MSSVLSWLLFSERKNKVLKREEAVPTLPPHPLAAHSFGGSASLSVECSPCSVCSWPWDRKEQIGGPLREASRSRIFSHLGSLRSMTTISPSLRAAQATNGPFPISSFTAMMTPCPRLSPGLAPFSTWMARPWVPPPKVSKKRPLT